MGDDTLNTSRFTKPALEMTRLEAYTMVAMHAILLGEGGGQLSPEEVGENAAAMAEASLIIVANSQCTPLICLWGRDHPQGA